MSNIKIILGSKSPRRHALIQELGFPVEIRPLEVEEIYPKGLTNLEIPEYLAKLKAQPHIETLCEDELLITSDTVVIHKNEIIGKPGDQEHAIELLRDLSNSTHTVVTGVHIHYQERGYTFSNHTEVTFNELSEQEIMHYIDEFTPFDKAGSYGIQEWIGYIGVKGIKGCYYNVMGLPVSAIYQVLKQEFDLTALD